MDTSVTTSVDGLLDLLRKKKKVSLAEASKTLGVPQDTIQLWVDFLVEEKVIGVEYKFTKPFIYLNEKQKETKGKIIKEEEVNIDQFKKDFENRAKESNIPTQQASFLWKDHILNQLELEKPFFFREAKKRNLKNIELLWEEYKQELVKE